MSLKQIIGLALALAPAALQAETVRWEILNGIEMTPEDGNPQWYTASVPLLPAGTSIDFTDGDMARTTAPPPADNTSDFTVDKDGKVVPYASFTPTAVDATGADLGDAVWYTLQGLRADNPRKGIYIRVDRSGKASKVRF